ncbi:MAG: arylsulfatase A-like enzyme [Limisphaerales bacterium]
MKELDLNENTLVIWTNDNGAPPQDRIIDGRDILPLMTANVENR